MNQLEVRNMDDEKSMNYAGFWKRFAATIIDFIMLNLSLKFIFLVALATLLATRCGTSKNFVVHKPVGNYTLAWSNRDFVSPIVIVNGVALSGFGDMRRIDNVRVLQFPNETLYVFEVWCGAPTQNSQLMLVRLSDQMLEEAVSVIGPTTLEDQFNRIEIIPLKKKGLMVSSLFNFYIDNDKVAVYRYLPSHKFLEDDYAIKSDSKATVYEYSPTKQDFRKTKQKWDKVAVPGYSPGYLEKVLPAASLGGVWWQRYTAKREAVIAEIIAAALEYKQIDSDAREVLAGVIVSGKSASGNKKIGYTVDEMRYTHGSDGIASIKLYINAVDLVTDGEEPKTFDSICLVEIKLWRRKLSGYVIHSVTLTGIAD